MLGCGDVGFRFAKKLLERGTEVVVVDHDLKRVESLAEHGFKAVQGDFGSPEVLRRAGIERAEVVLILAPDRQAVERALGAINQLRLELGVEPVVVARADDPLEERELKSMGATEVLPSSEILADFAFARFRELEAAGKERKLRGLMRRVKGKVAVVLHTNPDPDAIASGLAFKSYLSSLGLEGDLIYDGQIGHHQNRALVNLLNIPLLHAEKVKLRDYQAHVLVDVATPANCALSREIEPVAVVDHHPVAAGEVRAKYQDITLVGACATLMTGYLRYAGVEPDKPLATALALGILADTMNFSRGVGGQDLDAFSSLWRRCDPELLGRLQQPPFSPETLATLAKAIKACRVKEGYLIANVGEIVDRDALPQAADYLLRHEGVMTALVYGVGEDAVYISARTNDVRLHLGNLLRETFGKLGSAGGHAWMAGAAIPLRAVGRFADKREMKKAIDRIVGKRFLEAVRPPRRRRKARE